MIEVVVVCGGRGTRMGQPKAALPFGHGTLVEHMACRFAPRPVILAAAAGQALPRLIGVKIVRDRGPSVGPAAGLAAGLLAADGPIAFAVAVDLPFIVPALADFLADEIGGADACVPVIGGVPQPLAAAYRTSLGVELLTWAGGPQSFLRRQSVTYLGEERVRRIDADLASFRDLDTPADLAAAVAELGISEPSE